MLSWSSAVLPLILANEISLFSKCRSPRVLGWVGFDSLVPFTNIRVEGERSSFRIVCSEGVRGFGELIGGCMCTEGFEQSGD